MKKIIGIIAIVGGLFMQKHFSLSKTNTIETSSTNVTDETEVISSENWQRVIREKTPVQKSDGIYIASSLFLPFREDENVEVGKMRAIFVEGKVEVYEKIKDDGVDAIERDYTSIEIGKSYQQVTKREEETITDDFSFVVVEYVIEGEKIKVIKKIGVAKTTTEDGGFHSSYGYSNEGLSAKTPWDAEKIPKIFLPPENNTREYIYLKTKTGWREYDGSGWPDAYPVFFFSKPITNSKYWKKLDDTVIWRKISEVNQLKATDRALDSVVYMKNGGMFRFRSVDFAFDQIALARVATRAVSIKIFATDEDGTEKEIVAERRYIMPANADILVDFDVFRDCCKADFSRRKDVSFRNIPILLTEDYNHATTIVEVEFFGESWLGNIFMSQSAATPCTSMSLERDTAPATDIDINKLSGIAVLQGESAQINITETVITFRYKSYAQAGERLEIMEGYVGNLVFFNPTRYKNGKLMELFGYLAHSGVVVKAHYASAENSVEIVLLQVNNTRGA